MNMSELRAGDRYRQPENLVLDVRTRHEYRRGHVPGAGNVPVDYIERDPARLASCLVPFERVFIHCSSGKRARRAYDALTGAGMTNLVLVRGGVNDWARAGHPLERMPVRRELATGLAAGLLAQIVVAGVDRVLRGRIGLQDKLRERLVREGSPHEVGGKRIAAKLLGRRLSGAEQRRAQMAFSVGYGLLWGAVYALVRRRVPAAGRALGLPFAGAFFLACDGVLAPLFRMTPGLARIPGAFNAKELANHAAWTASAELVHRAAERLPR